MDKNQKQWTLFILLSGLAIRLMLPFVIGNDIYKGDGAEYRFYAYNLEKYGVYSGEMGDPPPPSHDRTPGVPLLIYFMGKIVPEDSRLMLLPNVLAGWLLLFLLVKFAQRLNLRSKISRYCLLAYAFIPVVDYYAAQFYPEVPAAAFLFLSFWYLFRFGETRDWKQSAFAGAAIGLGSFFRPELSFNLIILCAAIFFISKPSMKSFASAMVPFFSFLLVLSPWIVRNYINEKQFIPLGGNFLFEKPDTLSNEERGCSRGIYLWLNTWHTQEKHVKMVAWDFMHADLKQLPPAAFENENEFDQVSDLQNKNQYDCGSDRVLLNLAHQRMAAHPFRHYLSLPLQRMFFLLFRTERFDSLPTGHLPEALVFALWILFALFSNLVSSFAILGMFFLKKVHPVLKWALVAAWARWIFFAWFYHVELRYMMLFFPVFFLIGLIFIERFASRGEKERV